MRNKTINFYESSKLNFMNRINEVSDEENEAITRAIEMLTEDDLKIVRSEIVTIY